VLEPALEDQISVLASALDAVDDAVIIKDDSLTIRYSNRAACRHVGLPAGGMVGLRASDLFAAEAARQMEADDRHVMDTARSVHASLPAQGLADETKPANPGAYRKTPILQDGRCVGVISVVPAAALPLGSAPSAMVLDRFFRQSILAIACLDRTLRFVWVNEAYARNGRRPREAFVGQDHFELYPHAENEALFRRVLETGEGFMERARPFIHPDQPDRPMTYWDIGLQPIRNDADEIDGLLLTLIDVTDHQVAQRQAGRAAERLSLAARTAAIGVWEYHLESQSLIWDESMFDLYGVDPNTFAGSIKDWSGAVHPDDLAQVQAEVDQAVRDNSVLDTTFRILRPWGEVRHMRAFAEIVPADQDAPRRMIGVNYDITDRVEPLERLEKISRNVPGVIYQFRLAPDGSTCIPYASEGIREMTGVAPEDVTDDATPVFAPLHPDDSPRVQASIDESARNLSLWSCEYRVNHPTRGEIWLSGRGMPERQPDGAILWHGFVTEVTDRRRQEERLHHLSEAIEQSPVSVVMTDTDGAIRYVNPKFCEITGYTVEEALGQNPRILKTGRTPPEEYARLWDTVLNGGTWTGEFLNRRKDGSQYWESAAISPIRDAHGHIRTLLAIKEDITPRKAMEEELRRSNAELENFAYVASHDLRQPLRMINSFTGLLEKTLADSLNDDTREMMDFVRDGARHMDSMLISLLEYSRVGRLGDPLADHDSRDLVDAALSHLIVDIEESGATVHVEGDWPTIRASRDEMLRLFDNLIGNALKYQQPDQAPVITLWAGPDTAGIWRFSVTDNGIGIDPGQTERVFGMFQRLHTRDAYDGTGIGLPLCRKIVEHHGGRIWIESEGTGRGTRVLFTLPMAAQSPEPT